MDSHVIIKSPVLTEKSTGMGEKDKKYTFRVDWNATKIEIKRAIEELFKVKVVRVNTSFVRGKKKRVRHSVGKTSDWKKAIVTLREGDKIEFA